MFEKRIHSLFILSQSGDFKKCDMDSELLFNVCCIPMLNSTLQDCHKKTTNTN